MEKYNQNLNKINELKKSLQSNVIQKIKNSFTPTSKFFVVKFYNYRKEGSLEILNVCDSWEAADAEVFNLAKEYHSQRLKSYDDEYSSEANPRERRKIGFKKIPLSIDEKSWSEIKALAKQNEELEKKADYSSRDYGHKDTLVKYEESYTLLDIPEEMELYLDFRNEIGFYYTVENGYDENIYCVGLLNK